MAGYEGSWVGRGIRVLVQLERSPFHNQFVGNGGRDHTIQSKKQAIAM